MKIGKHQLENGIKLFIINQPGAELISSNVIVGAGGRYESNENYGISHFLEHMVFKGTKSFPDYEVFIKELEDRGAVVNAWTSEQATCYWNIMPKENIGISLKALSEQVSAPLLKETEIDKERGPVLEEIKRSHDDPYSHIWHNVLDVMWPCQPIGGGVLGPVENIEKFQREDFEKYLKSHYFGNNMNICIITDLDSKKVLEKVKEFFSHIPKGGDIKPAPIEHKQTKPQLSVTYRDMKQGQFILGYKTFGAGSKDRPAMDVLMNVLGKGMGSLLFKEVREKRGLAYAVSGDMDYFSDAGAAYLYAGVNAEKAEEAIVTIKEIAKSLKTELLTEERLNKAKEFIRGIILYVTDGVEKSGNWYTTKSLLDPKYLNPEDYLNAVAAVTPQDVLRVANSIFKPENESLTIIGPFKDEEKFAKILTNTK